MKRFLIFLLLLFLLTTPAQGAQVSGAVALTFDGYSPQVVQTLDSLGAKGTFFLLQATPEAVERLIGSDHEIGLNLEEEQDVTNLSRRQIYAMLCNAQAQLPEGYRPFWLRPPEKWGDGFRQVAEVTRHGLLRWSLDARDGLTGTQLDQIRSGDVIALGDISPEALGELVAILRCRNLEPVTVTELAGYQDMDILPGKVYEKFPVRRTGNFEVRITYPQCSGRRPTQRENRRRCCPWHWARGSYSPER